MYVLEDLLVVVCVCVCGCEPALISVDVNRENRRECKVQVRRAD